MPLPSGTVTFLFTDIEGSTRLLQRIGDGYALVLDDQRRILRGVFEKYHGFEIDTQGDSFFIVFPQALPAILACAEAQRALATHVWPMGEKVCVRMGLHTGEPQITATGYVGLDVHRAARICSSGHGGQVLLSEATCKIVEQALPWDIKVRDLGEYRLKDLQHPERIYQLVIPGLPCEYPPLQTLHLLHNNLPVQLTSFIGREREIREIQQLLSQNRLVTLVGSGGSGKTRLALQASNVLMEEFPEGTWFVDLAPLTNPTFLTQAVASVLGIKEEGSRNLHDSLVDYLQNRRVLLILDNCEHLVQACAGLAENLLGQCPKLKILITSREALGIAGENLLAVPPLSVPSPDLLSRKATDALPLLRESEAVRLFQARAASFQLDFNLTEANVLSVAQICSRLDGIPLAIELAAARIRSLSPAEMLSRLDDRFHLLTTGLRTSLPRQQNLYALIEWSYDLLSPGEKLLFRRLSVFMGGWSLEAAEAICAGEELPAGEVADLLTHLVDKSLVLADPVEEATRYHMLETIRQFALERLQRSGEEQILHQRHIRFFFNFVQAGRKGLEGPEISSSLKRLDIEKDNLYSGLEWAIQNAGENAEMAQEMASGLWMYWLGRGSLSEGRQWLKKVLECSQDSHAPRAHALAGLGTMIWNQGEIAEACRYLDESLGILRALQPPDLRGLAHATHIRGHLALDLSDYLGADRLFNESLVLYQELDDEYWMATLISDLGMVAYHQEDYPTALSYQERSLLIHQKYGNIDVIAQTLHRIGELARLGGDYNRAEECYEISLKTYREIGMKLEVASNLHKLGFIAQHHGEYQKARSCFLESLALQREVGNKQGIAECLAGLAGLAAVEKRPQRALCLYGVAHALLQAIHAPLAPADQKEWQRDETCARSQLDESASELAWMKGLSMPLPEALRIAVEEPVAQGNPEPPLD